MSERTKRLVVVVAGICFVVGVILSRRIDPGVRVERTMLLGKTPALRVVSATPGPHPLALLVHGLTACKENMFAFGEALAHAGFDCYLADMPGHGESRERF